MSINVNPTSYNITTEDLVITFTATGKVGAYSQILLDGSYIQAKSTTDTTSVYSNSDFKIGTNNISRLAVIEDDTWSMYDNSITVIKSETSSNIPVQSVSVTPSSANVATGGYVDLQATISPSNATNKNVTWSSLNPTLASVSQNGRVMATREGTAYIRVVTEDGNKFSDCTLTITDPIPEDVLISSISLNKTSHVFNSINSVLTLTPTILPENATNKSVSWSSSNENVAIVDNGVVTSKGEGTCNIRCDSIDGSNKYAYCSISVEIVPDEIPVSSVTVSPTSQTLKVGRTLQLVSTVLPVNATDKRITYSSNNTSIASVDSNGLITATTPGTTTVTVRSIYDNTKYSNCSITVEHQESTNNPPRIGKVIVSDEGYDGSYTLTYIASDDDNDTLAHRLKLDTGNYNIISPIKDGTRYIYKGKGLSVGTHTGYIQISDGKTSVVSEAFNIAINQRPTSVKVELKNAKDNYDAKHTALKETITQIISDGIFSKDEKALLEFARNEYNKAFSVFTEISHKALDYISNKKVYDAKKLLDKEIADINVSIDGIDGILNGALEDNILDESEKMAIKNNMQLLGNEKADVDKQYQSLYENKDLVGTPKTDLKTSYDNYVLKYNRLISTINDILNKTSHIEEVDRTKLNTCFDELRTALGDFRAKSNSAIDAIAKKIANDSSQVVDSKYAEIILDAENGIVSKVGHLEAGLVEANSKIEQTAKDITLQVTGLESKVNATTDAIKKDIEDINKELSNIEGSISDAIKDGILTEAEIKIIKDNIRQLDKEKADIDARHEELYNNKDLT